MAMRALEDLPVGNSSLCLGPGAEYALTQVVMVSVAACDAFLTTLVQVARDDAIAPGMSLNEDKHVTLEGWRDALSAWLTALSDVEYHVDHLVTEGHIVAAATLFNARHRRSTTSVSGERGRRLLLALRVTTEARSIAELR